LAALPAVVEPAPPAPPPDPFPAKKTFRDCEDAACPVMVVVPAGSFLMGSPASEPGRYDDEGPQHKVSIAKFALGQFEVTQGEWKALMGNNPSQFSQCGDKCPVENVSWEMAQEYVKKLSTKTGQNYRLPSEAEWEYAARAGTTTAYAFGATLSSAQANVNNEKGKTVEVGSYAANGFGLRDMHGNVWEWVQDCWHDTYENSPINGESWETNCQELRRILRGGGWSSNPSIARAADRNGGAPGVRDDYSGFRLARTLAP
jgi:formylglycine-generating enzyme required for sulfatase activity